jgi:tetratricopeptide (TPR) repeat protein
MIAFNLRAFATALFLGSAVAVVGALPMAAPAEAAARPAVGKALQEAIRLAGSGNISGANEKVREAEAVGGLTPGDEQAIAQTKEYIAAKGGGGGGGATGAKAKFANDYNAGRYRDVVGEDADELRKTGTYDGQSELIVAQAYYLMGDNAAAIRMLRDMHSEQAIELMMSAAFKSGDHDAMRDALEQLVLNYNQPKYWAELITNGDQTSGLSPENTMDLYRLRLLTDTMRNADDYMTASEVAIQVGCPTESLAIVQKGMDTKLLTGDRTVRLMNMAKTQSAAETANLVKEAAAANASKTGDADVKLSEQYWGMARYQDALDAGKAGAAKGPTDNELAQIRIGMAYVGLHQKDAAVRAFNQASKGKPGDAAVAHLWSIYARTH